MRAWIAASAAVLAVSAVASAAWAGDVTVTVHGIQARHGTVYVVVDDQDHFLKPGTPFVAVLADPPAGDHAFVLKNVPAGDYAVAVLHDENDNKQMDYDSSGRPAEGWAMTRFGPEAMHPPAFDDAKVSVPADGASFDVTMSYPAQ